MERAVLERVLELLGDDRFGSCDKEVLVEEEEEEEEEEK